MQTLSKATLFCLAPLLLVACQSDPADSSGEAEEQPSERPPREFEFVLIEGEPMYTVLPPDGIPAIDLPEHVSADEADAFMQPDEPVLGVVGRDGRAVAYSAWQLDGHEIVNDELDGQSIAATW